MRTVVAAIVGLLLAGCAAEHVTRTPAKADAPTPHPGPQTRASIPIEPLLPPPAEKAPEKSPPMAVPAGTMCMIHGSGAPFMDPCGNKWFTVSADERGTQALARFDPRDVDITWGFTHEPSRVWVGLRPSLDGSTLTGFTTNDGVFGLSREVEPVPGHVWLEPGTPVRIVGMDAARGPIVRVDGDIRGVDAIRGPVPCDALAYDPNIALTAAPARDQQKKPIGFGIPKHKHLTIRFEAGGRPRATIRVAPDANDLVLDIFETLGPFERVVFDTDHAHFDVWVERAEVEEEELFSAHGMMGDGGQSCRGFGDGPDPPPRATLAADAEVRVSSDPRRAGPPGLLLAKGETLGILSRKHGYAQVDAFGAIAPPVGLAFWIPESALERDGE